MKKITFILSTFLIFYSTSLFAQRSGSNFSIEPIVGYERVQKLVPTQHTKDRLIYGVRATWGPSLLALEAEITQGKDAEDFPDDNLSIKEVATNAKLGIRSSILNTKFIRWYARAGGHARQSEITTTQSGVTTTKKPAVKVSPYAGTGFGFNFNNAVRINAGLTVIFTGEPKGSDREYQTTLGFAIKI